MKHLLRRNHQHMIFDIMALNIDPEEVAQEPSTGIGLLMDDPKIDHDGKDETRHDWVLKTNIARREIDWLCNRMEYNPRTSRWSMEMIDCNGSYSRLVN